MKRFKAKDSKKRKFLMESFDSIRASCWNRSVVNLKMASRNSNVGKLFDFNISGYGVVTHEVRVDYKTWSPVIQILKFTDDEHKDQINLRFGYCDEHWKTDYTTTISF
jgi:hypothetical protein